MADQDDGGNPFDDDDKQNSNPFAEEDGNPFGDDEVKSEPVKHVVEPKRVDKESSNPFDDDDNDDNNPFADEPAHDVIPPQIRRDEPVVKKQIISAPTPANVPTTTIPTNTTNKPKPNQSNNPFDDDDDTSNNPFGDDNTKDQDEFDKRVNQNMGRKESVDWLHGIKQQESKQHVGSDLPFDNSAKSSGININKSSGNKQTSVPTQQSNAGGMSWLETKQSPQSSSKILSFKLDKDIFNQNFNQVQLLELIADKYKTIHINPSTLIELDEHFQQVEFQLNSLTEDMKLQYQQVLDEGVKAESDYRNEIDQHLQALDNISRETTELDKILGEVSMTASGIGERLMRLDEQKTMGVRAQRILSYYTRLSRVTPDQFQTADFIDQTDLEGSIKLIQDLLEVVSDIETAQSKQIFNYANNIAQDLVTQLSEVFCSNIKSGNTTLLKTYAEALISYNNGAVLWSRYSQLIIENLVKLNIMQRVQDPNLSPVEQFKLMCTNYYKSLFQEWKNELKSIHSLFQPKNVVDLLKVIIPRLLADAQVGVYALLFDLENFDGEDFLNSFIHAYKLTCDFFLAIKYEDSTEDPTSFLYDQIHLAFDDHVSKFYKVQDSFITENSNDILDRFIPLRLLGALSGTNNSADYYKDTLRSYAKSTQINNSNDIATDVIATILNTDNLLSIMNLLKPIIENYKIFLSHDTRMNEEIAAKIFSSIKNIMNIINKYILLLPADYLIEVLLLYPIKGSYQDKNNYLDIIEQYHLVIIQIQSYLYNTIIPNLSMSQDVLDQCHNFFNQIYSDLEQKIESFLEYIKKTVYNVVKEVLDSGQKNNEYSLDRQLNQYDVSDSWHRLCQYIQKHYEDTKLVLDGDNLSLYCLDLWKKFDTLIIDSFLKGKKITECGKYVLIENIEELQPIGLIFDNDEVMKIVRLLIRKLNLIVAPADSLQNSLKHETMATLDKTYISSIIALRPDFSTNKTIKKLYSGLKA